MPVLLIGLPCQPGRCDLHVVESPYNDTRMLASGRKISRVVGDALPHARASMVLPDLMAVQYAPCQDSGGNTKVHSAALLKASGLICQQFAGSWHSSSRFCAS